MSEFDKKISALTSGTDSTATDEYVIARGGSNLKISGALVAAAATKLGTIAVGTWQGTAIANAYIATGLDATKLTVGATLPSNVLASSLTSVGTLASLAVTGDLTVDTDTLYVKSSTNQVSIGTTTPSGAVALTVSGEARVTGNFYAADGTASAPSIRFWNSANGLYYPGSDALGFSVNGAERMRIDASGNVGIGVTPESKLDVNGSIQLRDPLSAGPFGVLSITNGTYDGGTNVINAINSTNLELRAAGSAHIVKFTTNATERARITAGGYFKASNAGTYGDAASYHEMRQSADNYIAFLTNTHVSAPFGPLITYTAAAPNGTGNAFIAGSDTGGTRFALRSNGGLANYQGNNVDLSDARTKTDITPLDSTWGKIAALEIVSYKYIDQTHDDVNIGVIAQQVETVDPVWVDNDGFGGLSKRETPEAVGTDADAALQDADEVVTDEVETDETETAEGVLAESVTAETAPEPVTYDPPLKTVYNKDIYFAAIKALQEAMARIESLEARLDALEN
jgi:hypothetical protein